MSLSSDIAAFKDGDVQAFERIYDRYAGKVYNFVTAMVRDGASAEDLTQNLFVHLWEKRDNIDPDGNPGAYIYTMARNMVYRHLKSRSSAGSRYLELFEQEGYDMPTIDSEIDHAIVEMHIAELIERLPPSRREIFMMRWQQEMTNKEIARRLSVSEKTVSTQIHRSMAFLRDKLSTTILAAAAISESL